MFKKQLAAIVGSMKHTVKQSEVISNFNDANTAIANNVIGVVTNMADMCEELDVRFDKVKLLQTINTNSNYKARTPALFFKTLALQLQGLVKNYSSIVTLAEKELSEIIGQNLITEREAGIINVAENYAFLAVYIPDLVDYTVRIIDEDVNSMQNDMSKGRVKDIVSASYDFSTILAFYYDNKDIASVLKDVPVTRVIANPKDAGAASVANKDNANIDFKGFIGNPFYHVRMWVVDKDLDRYEVLKDKKTYLNMKIIDLKSRAGGEASPAMQKQISYYEDKLENTEYRMRKLLE